MNKPINFKKIILIILLLAIATGIVIFIMNFSKLNKVDTEKDWETHNARLKNLDQEMQKLSSEIKEAAGEGACKDDYQCRVIGLGSKTCDGYANFLVYSTFDTQENRLLAMVEQFNELDKTYNELSMKVLNCGEAPLPAKCIRERCTVHTN